MGYTADIDTGGTFTDGFFTRGGEFHAVKTATTPHDLTLCFMECLKAGAQAFGVALGDFLEHADLIRFSNTIGTNTIIERNGSRVGLLLTQGNESLAPLGDQKHTLLLPEMVLGLSEEVSVDGAIVRAPEASAIMAAAQTLIDRGARCLVVALANSEANPANEQLVRETIKREYPRDYLGSVPVFLASDISARSGYAERINTAVLNAYIHSKLTRLLYKSGEDLRRNRYRGHLFIGHNNGAAARVAKTRAINTYNSGPAAGLLGAREIGALYGARQIISGDMGGTSYDLGLIRDGEPGFSLRPDVEGFRCNLPMLSILALGAGGGSIATLVDGELRVGPRSAGALPGPACFDLGGADATVTDANLVLGLLDSDFFLGGAKKLNLVKARAAIENKIAKPLNISVEDAALRIVNVVDANVACEIARLAGNEAQNTLMVVYGGAGPLHCCSMAQGIGKLVVTPYSAVFSAYSSSLMDVGHIYYRRSSAALSADGDFTGMAQAISEMRVRAEQDMRGEGFAPENLYWTVELIVQGSDPESEARLTAAADFFRAPQAVARLAVQAKEALGEKNGQSPVITSIGLFARAGVPHFKMAAQTGSGRKLQDAQKSQRDIYLGAGHAVKVPVYDRDRLECGHQIDGPALVESVQTTIWVAQGWRLTVDQYQNAVLERMPS
ncbi:MAG: hydantoinase/oxoprolinase family protein [Betaproteobacteria bacterium]|nr:hydantoinase/oxoprolinase family protein [Betaproteobacteria bacterium]